MPVPARQIATGTILVDEPTKGEAKARGGGCGDCWEVRRSGTIVVERRERLARFGVEYVEAALAPTADGWLLSSSARLTRAWCAA